MYQAKILEIKYLLAVHQLELEIQPCVMFNEEFECPIPSSVYAHDYTREHQQPLEQLAVDCVGCVRNQRIGTANSTSRRH